MTRLRAALLVAGCALAPAAAAQDATPAWPTIREIAFSGNATTRPAVLLREMVVRVGDPADPDLLERSRQAIQDLRLFGTVELRQEPLADGVRVRVAVEEKHYLLPLPRASLNSDGQSSYGVGMRWWNVLGLNHTLHLTVAQRDRQEAGRGPMLRYHASYEVPFLFDSPYGLEVEYLHSEEPVTDSLFSDETTETARALLSRSLDGASHGWRLGAGVQWQDQQRDGLQPVASPGQATALVLRAAYDDTRFNLHSEEGRRFSVEGRGTAGPFASDYAYRELFGRFEESWRIGAAPHQTFGVFGQAGAYRGGPDGVPPPFALGGSDSLRGYPLNFLRGQRYYFGGIEFLRPLHWDWLRGMAFIEAGDTFGAGAAGGPDGIFADAGVGVRLRWSGFVNTEFSFGVAYPLVDPGNGGSMRFFGTGDR